MNIVAILTGKGNNTLKDKNILSILNHPVMYYPCIEAKKSKYINDFYVSSEDEKILNIGSELGYKKIIRPKELSTQNAQHKDVIRHAINEINQKIDILIILLANSVVIKREWIDQSIEMIINDNSISSVVPVEENMNHHPYRAKKFDNGKLQSYFNFNNNISSNRNDLPKNYFLCHNFWTLNLNNIDFEHGEQPWVFLGENVKPIIIKDHTDIHILEDIITSERWLIENNMV